jgi:hemoglobin
MLKQIKEKMLGKSQQHLGPNHSPYDRMGKKKVLLLANSFYDEMESNPDVAELLAIHPQPVDKIRVKFYEFLSGWLGGPDLFVEKYGHPRLRARHLPFQINHNMYVQWMTCMQVALNKVLQDDPVLKADLRVKFDQLARHMINQD